MSQAASHKLSLATINSTGRQAASLIRSAQAIGWHVRGHAHRIDDDVARELNDLANVTLLQGDLADREFVKKLFDGVDIAFVNTTHWGDEVTIGCLLADLALEAGIKHYVFSSMPDHSSFGRGWRPLPLWARKFTIEKYLRTLKQLQSTFVYAGCYNNNFTSLRYPVFGLELQPDGSFVWQAPFHPEDPIPWLDAEHDMGPALIQIFKEGPKRWAGHRIPLTFEVLSPRQACKAFSKGLGRPVKYRRGPIEINVPVPDGYREHLEAMQEVLGDQRAPFYGPDMYYPHEALVLWEGNRGLEEYAREIFPNEEANNGLTWMDDETSDMEHDGGHSADNSSSLTAEEVRAEAESNFTGPY